MSNYRKTVRHFWPWNTLRAAYLEWLAQESHLAEARQRLVLEYQAACMQAERVQIEIDQGILRASRLWLDQPLDPRLLMVRDRLQRAFSRRGKGFFRRVPSPLQVELAQYVASIEKICRRHSGLRVRLRLAQAIMTMFDRKPEFCSLNFFRLALISPESAWLLFHLRQKRRKDRQANQDCLTGGLGAAS